MKHMDEGYAWVRHGTLTVLSAPEEAKRISGCPGPLADTNEPAGAAGAHETAVTPKGCAFGTCIHHIMLSPECRQSLWRQMTCPHREQQTLVQRAAGHTLCAVQPGPF